MGLKACPSGLPYTSNSNGDHQQTTHTTTCPTTQSTKKEQPHSPPPCRVGSGWGWFWRPIWWCGEKRFSARRRWPLLESRPAPIARSSPGPGIPDPDHTSFFFHLGDIIYLEKGGDQAATDGSEAGDTPALWNTQFYAPYTDRLSEAHRLRPAIRQMGSPRR